MTITGSDYLNLATAVERYLVRHKNKSDFIKDTFDNFLTFTFQATDHEFRNNKKLKHHLGCSRKTTNFYILKIFLLTVLFNVPAFFELKTSNQDPTDNSTQLLDHYEVFETDLRRHEVYTSMYRYMAEFLIFKVTPWFSFLILWMGLNNRIR
jgi:hypothetical protein